MQTSSLRTVRARAVRQTLARHSCPVEFPALGEPVFCNDNGGPRQGTGVGVETRTLLAIVSSVSACLPTGAEQRIEEVVVSASRLGPVDQHVEVLDDEELALSVHASDALRALPGLALAASGNRGALTQGRLRGAEANHLLVLVDGVAVNSPAAGSEFDFGGLDLAAVRRVELLAGPQSAVWGSDALAGVLYMDTTPRQSRRRAAYGFGSANTRDADVEWSAVGERGFGALDLGWMASDGTNAALTGNERDGYANRTAHLRAGGSAGRWELSSSLRWSDARVEYDPSPPPRFVPSDGDRTTRNRTALLKAEVRLKGLGRVAPVLTLARFDADLLNRADGAATNAYAGRRDRVTLSANVLFDRQRINLAAEAETERFEQRGAATPFGDPNQRQRTATASIIGEYQVDFSRLAATASLRRDFNDAFEHAFAYRVGVTTLGNPRWFASTGRGVKNPTFTERFGFTPDTFIGNPDLEPEVGTGAEAGLKWAWGGGSLVVLAFDSVLRREIDGFAFDPERGGFTARNRAGKSKRRGAELALEATLRRLEVRASYAFVDAADAAGEQEARRPRRLANLSLRAPVTPRWAVGMAVSHVGSSFDHDYSTFPARRVTLAGYRPVRFDATFRASPTWRLSLLVDNVLNADAADLFGYRSPGRTALARVEVAL